MNVSVERENSTYFLLADLGQFVPTLKFDTGSQYTVISAGMLGRSLTADQKKHFKDYCEKHSSRKEKFISASGDPFFGYPVSVHDVNIGGTSLPVFYYYLVIENKRDIALLGFDFIDRCKCSHNPHGNFVITEFDEDGYGKLDGVMENDDVMAFIDSLGD